jgi:hypothetical protein
MTKRVLVACVIAAAVWMCAGCSHTYPYLATDEGCQCEEYTRSDRDAHLTYHVAATYAVGSGIITDLRVEMANGGIDTVDASGAFIKVTSHNVPYEYNGRYISVGIHRIPPGEIRTLTLRGEYTGTHGENLWLRIAGEELSIVLDGFTAGDRRISRQEFHFIPRNPYLTQ